MHGGLRPQKAQRNLQAWTTPFLRLISEGASGLPEIVRDVGLGRGCFAWRSVSVLGTDAAMYLRDGHSGRPLRDDSEL